MANIFNVDPAIDAEEVTTSDTTPTSYRALYVGGTGDVKIKTAKGTTVTFANVAAGQILHVRATLVYSTGTTATDIVGLV